MIKHTSVTKHFYSEMNHSKLDRSEKGNWVTRGVNDTSNSTSEQMFNTLEDRLSIKVQTTVRCSSLAATTTFPVWHWAQIGCYPGHNGSLTGSRLCLLSGIWKKSTFCKCWVWGQFLCEGTPYLGKDLRLPCDCASGNTSSLGSVELKHYPLGI